MINIEIKYSSCRHVGMHACIHANPYMHKYIYIIYIYHIFNCIHAYIDTYAYAYVYA